MPKLDRVSVASLQLSLSIVKLGALGLKHTLLRGSDRCVENNPGSDKDINGWGTHSQIPMAQSPRGNSTAA